MTASARPRIGIVGAGRTRQGLGPYLARWFEVAGCDVVAVSGRDPARAADAAAALASDLGHAVSVAPDARALARQVDALVVACPVAGHLDGLDAALEAGVPCLCEKPLVAATDLAAGRERVAAFRARGLLLAENCQWPFVLPAFDALYPGWRDRAVRALAMGLGPGFAGPAMVADSLSHVLSVAQAVAPLSAHAEVVDVRQADAAPDAVHNVVRFRVVDASGAAPAAPLDVELHLTHSPAPPRPAWLALDGRRADRRIGAGYAISFVAPDGRGVNVRDPLELLVYGFAANLQGAHVEPARAHADSVDLRLRLYADVLQAIGG